MLKFKKQIKLDTHLVYYFFNYKISIKFNNVLLFLR